MAEEFRAMAGRLEEFGLSQYEAMAYVALVSGGPMSVSEIAYETGMPRTKVYPVLQKLEKKRLAVLSKSKPVSCEPIGPEEAFGRMIEDQKGRLGDMNDIVSSLKRAGEAGKKERRTKERRYVESPVQGVQDRLASAVAGAKSSVCAMSEGAGLAALASCRDGIASALRRGVDVRIIIGPAQAGTQDHMAVPSGAAVRISEVVQDCIICDRTEVFAIDAAGSCAAAFPSAGALGACQSALFERAWQESTRTSGMEDMAGSEMREVYEMVRLVGSSAVGRLLAAGPGRDGAGMIKMLEKSGISISDRGIEEVTAMIDCALQVSCRGGASVDSKSSSISIESGLNSGHSLPWAAIMEGYLGKNGYKTRTVYHAGASKGERVHLKFAR